MSVEDFADAGFYSATSILAFESGTKRMHPFIWMAYKHILGVQDLVKIK